MFNNVIVVEFTVGWNDVYKTYQLQVYLSTRKRSRWTPL